jgi:predicted nucleic acid-binding protein
VTDYLLDTNIISEATRPTPAPALTAWMEARDDSHLFITSLTLAEVHRGILDKPKGRKRQSLESWFAGPEGPQSLFAGRILSFDVKSALIWGRLMSEGAARGRPRSPFDMMIAAIAEANHCIVVTGNARDFVGIEIVNPLRAES